MFFTIVPPFILNELQDLRVPVHRNITLECLYEPGLNTNITWLRDESIIDEEGIIVTSDSSSTLSLYNVSIEDSGLYVCLAENEAGSRNISAFIEVGKH